MISKLLMQFHSLLSTGFMSSSCSRGVYAIESCRSLTNITEVVHVISLLPLFLFYNFVYLFIYYSFWLCGVFVTAQAFFSLRQAGTPFQLWCFGFSLEGLLLPQSTGSRAFSLQKLWLPGSGADSGVGAPGPSCSATRGTSPDQGGNPCLLQWQLVSLPPKDQGSPPCFLFSSLSNPAPLDSC